MSGLLPVVKLATHVMATVGVSKVVGDIIRNNTNVVTTADAVKVWTGSFVIGAMVAEAAQNSVNSQWNAVADWYTNRKTDDEAETPEIVTE